VAEASLLPGASDTGGRPPLLVVGIGSELRRDDAAGRRVAEAIAGRGFDDVEVRSVHQLTPELAVDLDARELVVFVDAAVDVAELMVRELPGGVADAPGSHHVDPPALLALATCMGWAPRRAAVVHIPVIDLDLGTELSPATWKQVELAVTTVVDLLRSWGRQLDPD
jgi:hydrogenase maturation protease